MKKKIISLALVLCVLCVGIFFVGCEKESVTEVINNALKNTQALDSMDAELKMEMNMSMEGMSMSVPVVADMKAKGLKGDNPIESSAITMSLFGEEMKIEMYNEGDWAYIVADDMKYKTNIAEEIGEYDYFDDVTDMIKSLPEELLADVKAEKGSDSSTTITISVPEDKFKEIYSDFIKSLNEDQGALDGEVKITDAVVKITALNGYVSVYDMTFTMDVTVEGVSTKTSVKSTVTYKNPGQEVTVTAPEGYKDFEELDLGDLGDLEDLEGLENMEDLGDLEDLEGLDDYLDLENFEF